MNETEYEQWLQERCEIMLEDFLHAVLDAKFDEHTTTREAHELIDKFMRTHNLK